MVQSQKEKKSGECVEANPIHDPVIRYNLHIHHKDSSIIIQSYIYRTHTQGTYKTPHNIKILEYKIIYKNVLLVSNEGEEDENKTKLKYNKTNKLK